MLAEARVVPRGSPNAARPTRRSGPDDAIRDLAGDMHRVHVRIEI
jgi:hypothetical protein